jgi:hypothetical protein
MSQPLFKSFFMAGFECSIHKRQNGQRLDLIASTKHDRFAIEDYQRLFDIKIRVAREGVRWHLAEPRPGIYDFSSVNSVLEASEKTGTEIIWDILHFGWPDHVDVLSPDFPSRLAGFAAAFVRFLKERPGYKGWFVPINEISFLSWAGGDEGIFNPFLKGKGFELKCQLVAAAICTMREIKKEDPQARFMHIDPLIHVTAHPSRSEDREKAEEFRMRQYQAWDMLAGRLLPEYGGEEKYLDVIGVNYYIHNQWYYDLVDGHRTNAFEELLFDNPHYRPLREMLKEIYDRYQRPIVIAETGAEGDERIPWFNYVTAEILAAQKMGVPIHGVCIYPILNYPGWDDDRCCPTGLWGYADERGVRSVFKPLVDELAKHQLIFEANR